MIKDSRGMTPTYILFRDGANVHLKNQHTGDTELVGAHPVSNEQFIAAHRKLTARNPRNTDVIPAQSPC